MSSKVQPHYADAKGVIVESFNGDAVVCEGSTVPSDGVAGFAPGCLWWKRGGGAATGLYKNEGSNTSCAFKAVSTGPEVISVTSSTYTVTAEQTGKTFALNRAAGIAVTLPTAAAGLRFRFIVGTTFTGAASIKSVTGADVMVGNAVMGNDSDNTVVRWPAVAASTFDTIDLFGTANSTGGIEGQEIEIIGIAANKWFVSINGDAAGTEATPFADTVT